MAISSTPLDYALNNRIGQTTTQIELLDNTATQIGIASCTFTTASGGYIHLSAVAYIAVSSGVTIKYLRLYKTGTIIWNQTLTEYTYTANGTYTVSDLQITLGE